MGLGFWIQLGLMAFVGGSLLRLGAETGIALFTMLGMITFVLVGLRALAEVNAVQIQAGVRDLERILREAAARWPALRLPAGRPGSPQYVVRAGRCWVVLGIDTTPETGLWRLVQPGLGARARRLEREAKALPLDQEAEAVHPVLVLVRRRVRRPEEELGEAVQVPLVNAEALPGLLEALAAADQAEGRYRTAGTVVEGSGDAGAADWVQELAKRLGARVLKPSQAKTASLAAGS